MDEIQKFAQDNNFQIKGDFSELKSGIFSNPLESKISQCSKSEKKKINQAIYRFDKKNTIKTSNYLLHILFKDIMKSETRVKILPSEKEVNIQNARKKWKEAQAIAEKLLSEYKVEKGNFYKEQILRKAA